MRAAHLGTDSDAAPAHPLCCAGWRLLRSRAPVALDREARVSSSGQGAVATLPKPAHALPARAWREGTLELPERVVADGVALDLLLARASGTEWVVYCKPPFGGPEQVLAYLANYTHRIAISNSRIVSFDGERVSFRYRDYAHGNAVKLLALEVDEFLRRFLLHVLPPRLVRIRYYGFLANRSRARSIELARQRIGGHVLSPVALFPPDEHRCPQCGSGTLRLVGPVPAERPPPGPEDSL